MAEGAVFESLTSASILANSSLRLKGDFSGAFCVAGSAKLAVSVVAGSGNLIKVEMTLRKITLCPTTGAYLFKNFAPLCRYVVLRTNLFQPRRAIAGVIGFL